MGSSPLKGGGGQAKKVPAENKADVIAQSEENVANTFTNETRGNHGETDGPCRESKSG